MLLRHLAEQVIINKLKELESSGIYVIRNEWHGIDEYGSHQVTFSFHDRATTVAPPQLRQSIPSKIPGTCEWCKKDDEPTRQRVYIDMVFHHYCWHKYKLKHRVDPKMDEGETGGESPLLPTTSKPDSQGPPLL